MFIVLNQQIATNMMKNSIFLIMLYTNKERFFNNAYNNVKIYALHVTATRALVSNPCISVKKIKRVVWILFNEFIKLAQHLFFLF